jgi:hypothetical protein
MKKLTLKIVFPLICILLTIAFVAPVFAVEYNPGVSVGQWIKYGNYVVTTPAETVISPDWSMIEVIGVSGKEVTLRLTGAYMNGTAIPSSEIIANIETYRITEGMFEYQNYLLAANLNQGDKTLNVADVPTINKTETRTILGTSRSVNILNFTNSYPGQAMKSVIIYDKASGMSLGMEMEITIIEQAVTYKSSYGIIDTNIFEVEPIPEFQAWMLLPLLMTTTLLAVIIKKRKHTTQ